MKKLTKMEERGETHGDSRRLVVGYWWPASDQLVALVAVGGNYWLVVVVVFVRESKGLREKTYESNN